MYICCNQREREIEIESFDIVKRKNDVKGFEREMSKRKREKSDEEEHHKKQLVEDPEEESDEEEQFMEDPEYIVMRALEDGEFDFAREVLRTEVDAKFGKKYRYDNNEGLPEMKHDWFSRTGTLDDEKSWDDHEKKTMRNEIVDDDNLSDICLLATCFGSAFLVEILLDDYDQDVHGHYTDQRACLIHYAAMLGHTEVVKLLIQYGSALHYERVDKWSALFLTLR